MTNLQLEFEKSIPLSQQLIEQLVKINKDMEELNTASSA